MSKPITAAGIDIGSNAIKLLIAEIEAPGALRVLEDVRLDSPIGDDTFTTGRIGPEATSSVCRSLKQMAQLMKDYGVKHYRACATSGVREASNKLYFLEHIKQATPIHVELIDRSIERYLSYQALHYSLPSITQLREEGLLVIEVGSAGVQISLYTDGKLRLTDHIGIGTLKLKEVLDSLRTESLQFTTIIQQYIESQISIVMQRLQGFSIPHYLVMGGASSSIGRKWGTEIDGIRRIEANSFQRYHQTIVQEGLMKLAHKFQLEEDRAHQVTPTSIIMSEFWKATQAEHIMLPDVSLRHGMLHDYASDRLGQLPDQRYIEDILAVAIHTAERFHVDMEHALNVRHLAMKLYKACSKLFQLDPSDSLSLELAALLHDIGKFVSQECHELNSYQILQSMDLIGLTNAQKDLIANIALYHSRGMQIPIRPEYSDEENLTLARLTTILKLANALDCSHRQLIKDIRITRRRGEELVIKPVYEGSIEIEAWAFDEESSYFEQIFGYPIIIER